MGIRESCFEIMPDETTFFLSEGDSDEFNILKSTFSESPKTEVIRTTHEWDINVLSLVAHRDLLLSGDDDSNVVVYDLKRLKVIRRFENLSIGAISSLHRLQPTCLLVGGWGDGGIPVRVLDLGNMELVDIAIGVAEQKLQRGKALQVDSTRREDMGKARIPGLGVSSVLHLSSVSVEGDKVPSTTRTVHVCMAETKSRFFNVVSLRIG